MDEAELARTESLFREVNEAIAKISNGLESDDAEFICECGDPECVHRIQADLDDYEEVRTDGTHFLVAPGHAERNFERVIKRTPTYQVIEKGGRKLAAIARRLDPRRRPTTPPAPE